MDSNGARSNQWMGTTVVAALTVLATRSDHEVLFCLTGQREPEEYDDGRAVKNPLAVCATKGKVSA